MSRRGLAVVGVGVALLVALVPAARAEAGEDADTGGEPIGGHEEAWWRDRHEALVAEVEWLAARAAACEEREAPRAYDGVEGYVVRGRRGRARWVAIKRCDEERADLAATRGELERFEERARRAGVPPGWLR